VLIDLDPQDPFDFSLAHYKDQVVAGYTKITPDFGLRVFMRDFHKGRLIGRANWERFSRLHQVVHALDAV